MQYSKLIFNKDLYDLTIEDILDFFSTEQEETSILEFKDGRVELEGIYKEVGAFLNTSGGLLIVGSPPEKYTKKGKKRVKVCTGLPLPSTIIKNVDQLMRSISSNITPPPYKIKAHQIEYNEGSIYVIEIPQSFTPPHQVNHEGKYYIRLERDSKAAPHGIVEALFFKRQKPKLDSRLEVKKLEGHESYSFFISLINDSQVTAEKIGYILKIHGVHRAIKNSNGKIEGIEYFLSKQEDMILLNGINLGITIELELIKNLCLIELACYSKDSDIHKKYILLQPSKYPNTIKTLSSNDNTDTVENVDSIFSEFRECKNDSDRFMELNK